jgi:hypothetical protein
MIFPLLVTSGMTEFTVQFRMVALLRRLPLEPVVVDLVGRVVVDRRLVSNQLVYREQVSNEI